MDVENHDAAYIGLSISRFRYQYRYDGEKKNITAEVSFGY